MLAPVFWKEITHSDLPEPCLAHLLEAVFGHFDWKRATCEIIVQVLVVKMFTIY